MSGMYFVQTAAEAAEVTEQLTLHGFGVNIEPQRQGHRLTITRAPCVEVEEILINHAPSVHRISPRRLTLS
jgi:hypothetical protein